MADIHALLKSILPFCRQGRGMQYKPCFPKAPGLTDDPSAQHQVFRIFRTAARPVRRLIPGRSCCTLGVCRRRTIVVISGLRNSFWGENNADTPTVNNGLGDSRFIRPPAVSPSSPPLSHQQLGIAFQILDRDGDGLITQADAHKLVAYYLALQNHKPAPVQGSLLTWDQHLLAGLATSSQLCGVNSWSPAVLWQVLEAFVAAKMSGGLQKQVPRCSDLVWSALGMTLTVLILGVLSSAAHALPVVGVMHQQGLPLLLGSFGTLAILLFGRPDAEAVRLWPLVAGQLGAAAIAVSIIHIWGANLISRAAAMAATVAYMMWTDSIHPPGGALVLMAMDSKAIQAMGYSYLLWPSLLLCLAVMLPISAITNWLRRNRQFDWPGTSRTTSSLHVKQCQWAREQKQRGLVLQVGVFKSSTSFAVVHRVSLLLQDLAHYIISQGHILAGQLQQPLQQSRQQVPVKAQKLLLSRHRLPRHRKLGNTSAKEVAAQQTGIGWSFALDNGISSIDAAGAGTAAAAENLGAAVRRRLQREADRQLEDLQHREHLWGRGALSGLHKYEQKLDDLHQWRVGQLQQQEESDQQPGSLPLGDVRHGEGPNWQRPSWVYRWRGGQSNGGSQVSGATETWQ